MGTATTLAKESRSIVIQERVTTVDAPSRQFLGLG